MIEINNGIDYFLEQIYGSQNGPYKLSEIGAKLSIHQNQQIAQLLISKHQLFQDYAIQLRNNSMLQFNIEDVLDQSINTNTNKVKGFRTQIYENSQVTDKQLDVQNITAIYKRFDNLYWDLVQKNMFGTNFKLEIQKRVKYQKQYSVEEKIDLLTLIFAYWTLSLSSKNISDINDESSRKKLVQPHAAQLVAIFSLLGIINNNEITNQLIQVLTGEGKSVILAITATVLAIMGYEVNCVCYSNYLSQRDFKDFTNIFSTFNVQENIQYGTFNEMCEMFINQDGHVRENTEFLIQNKKQPITHLQNNQRQKILLIDEVDVFFNKDFYGNSYSPLAQVKSVEITSLIDYIWKNRNNSSEINYQKIKQTEQYKQCRKSLDGWEELLNQAILTLISDVKSFQSQQYIVFNGKIGYKDQDTISTQITYGYKTMFAYYQEHANSNIKLEELQNRIGLLFNCGSFSKTQTNQKTPQTQTQTQTQQTHKTKNNNQNPTKQTTTQKTTPTTNNTPPNKPQKTKHQNKKKPKTKQPKKTNQTQNTNTNQTPKQTKPKKTNKQQKTKPTPNNNNQQTPTQTNNNKNPHTKKKTTNNTTPKPTNHHNHNKHPKNHKQKKKTKPNTTNHPKKKKKKPQTKKKKTKKKKKQTTTYAEIPKKYQYIMGVTGTLETVSKPEIELLTNEYNIKQFSFIPSVYGTNKLNFAKDSSEFIQIVDMKEYYRTIVKEIQCRRKENSEIPVLVFFETSAKLELFDQSQEKQSIKNYHLIKQSLTEKVNEQDKISIIQSAVAKGAVTFITKEFGRGTDFICYDKSIDNNGGIHVIQTFVSDELSEERQIQGRTARQGNKGSYSLILLDSELEKYGLNSKDILTMKATQQLYSTIDPKRQKYFDGKYPERVRNIQEIKLDHEKSKKFVAALLSGNIAVSKEFLLTENKGQVEQCVSKTLIIMDATGSMGSVIEKTKNTIKTMFTNAFTVLQEQNYDQSFDVMFAAYRSYGDREMILQSSAWESKPDNLKKFVDTISASGGWSEEAMEIGLQHANFQVEKGLTQVIVIGDIGPTPDNEVQNRRNSLGEGYWQNTPFKNPTTATAELSKLKQKGIKVHAFYVRQSAASSFQHVANQTGGTCSELDVNSAKGAENLTHLVTSRIMENIGGEKLLKIYQAKFGFVGK
ncbi:Helicase-related_protein [Hexamita inflata]|uniref:Helicase-related protein n=1 Tax=Hexamita inflata TaxID=28002 RepID=A0AA86PEF7_9EUKA|nr:Helicase-related protein [Hexamita inflata]